MQEVRSLRNRPFCRKILATLAAWLLLVMAADSAWAIPVFARKYQTSCVTCHMQFPKLNPVGEAFRRNGYQFPSDEEVLVKEDPVSLGNDAYKDMFPQAIWPSTLPSNPPISVFALGQNIVHLTPHGQAKTWDLNMPSDIELVGAAALGKDITAFFDVAFSPQSGASVGRVFMQFSNLFSWGEEDDEDGARGGNRFQFLPPRAMNLRVGKIDPGIVPHLYSEEAVTQFPLLTPTFTLGQTGFALFAEQPAVELNGILRQNWSYSVGIANGGSASLLPQDDNTFKDVYFRVARRWFGYPMDGRLGQSAPGSVAAAPTKPDDDDPDDHEPVGMDYWRWVLFETGVFGWYGLSNVPLTPATNVPYDPNDPTTFVKNRFQRIGVDARLLWFDLDLYGQAFWGHDPFPGFDQNNIVAGATDHAGYFIEADYTINAWVMAFARYEQMRIFNGVLAGQEQGRVIPGVVLMLRQNLRLASEVYINTQMAQAPNPSIPQSTTQWITSLWFAF